MYKMYPPLYGLAGHIFSESFFLDEVEFMHVSYSYITNSNKGKCLISSGNHVCALELKKRDKKEISYMHIGCLFKTC